MTCRSQLGSSFRARFLLGYEGQQRRVDREVLLCPSHERECRELRDRFEDRLIVTEEGWVVSRITMDAMGFLA